MANPYGTRMRIEKCRGFAIRAITAWRSHVAQLGGGSMRISMWCVVVGVNWCAIWPVPSLRIDTDDGLHVSVLWCGLFVGVSRVRQRVVIKYTTAASPAATDDES